VQPLIVSLRIALATLLVCALGYTLLVLGVARIVNPDAATGSLVTDAKGRPLGSRLIAQKFEQPRHFWPRPSATDYDAAAAAGSNKSPTSSDLTERAKQLVARYGATAENPLPAELVAAPGSGLDPHITERAALYQAGRVANARGVARDAVEAVVREHAFAPGEPLTADRLLNVLELNLALDRQAGPHTASP
jgi:K+-transporting ATPase ATPase C chain